MVDGVLTLSSLMQDVAVTLNQAKDGKASGGSISTILDDGITEDKVEDDFIGRMIFVTRAGGLAPEGEFSTIVSYEPDTHEIGVSPSFSTAVADGDEYMYIRNRRFTVAWYRSQIYLALKSLESVRLADTSLVGVAGQTVYEVPLPVKASGGIQQLEISRDGSSAIDPGYYKLARGLWDYFPNEPGTEGELKFLSPPPVGQKIRLLYNGIHPPLAAFDDVVSEGIFPSVAVWAVIVQIRKASSLRTDQAKYDLNDAVQTLFTERTRHPIKLWPRDSAMTPLRISRGSYP